VKANAETSYRNGAADSYEFSSTYKEQRIAHWNTVAGEYDRLSRLGRYYHRRVENIYQFLVAPEQRVLELGCARGDLLAALRPAIGVGVDFSPEMISLASKRHDTLEFILNDAHSLRLENTFDVIILSDLLNDVWDAQRILEQVSRHCDRSTRVIINTFSRLWQIPFLVTERFELTKPNLPQNWLTVEDLQNLLHLSDFEVIHIWPEIMCPVWFPMLSTVCNRYLVRLWPFKHLGLTNFIVARPSYKTTSIEPEPTVSVIVPARNEAGNIASLFDRLPEMGTQTEIVFIEGHSKDNTFEVIEQEINDHPERNCKLRKQSGIGKGDAVRLGFNEASGDILMVLDADMTVPPEALPCFYDAIYSGKGEFINGVRLVYPMEEEAMRYLNQIGNKFFGQTFSWLLGQNIRDTLCGTKVLWKADYERITANRAYFGEFDPFGDFDLLLGAAKLNLKIVELPIRYRERTYGSTNIHRWRHGLLLLRMVIFAARRIKFV
jgi:ubiquinone/menaquinone biosynthesis C-methylase UbiE